MLDWTDVLNQTGFMNAHLTTQINRLTMYNVGQQRESKIIFLYSFHKSCTAAIYKPRAKVCESHKCVLHWPSGTSGHKCPPPQKKRKCLPTERCHLASCITGVNLSARSAAQSGSDAESELLGHNAQHNCRYINLQSKHQNPIPNQSVDNLRAVDLQQCLTSSAVK